jgi:hypothetical protein
MMHANCKRLIASLCTHVSTFILNSNYLPGTPMFDEFEGGLGKQLKMFSPMINHCMINHAHACAFPCAVIRLST